jgi:hypothetical protein
MCVLPSFAYRSVILIFECPRTFASLVEAAAVHHVPGRERVPQIVKAEVFDTSIRFPAARRQEKIR